MPQDEEAPAAAPSEAVLLTQKGVNAIEYGFGSAGACMQDGLHAPHLIDRFIMKQTLLLG